MLDFKELELSDKEKIEPFLAIDGSIMADRTFASLYIWREHYDVQNTMFLWLFHRHSSFFLRLSAVIESCDIYHFVCNQFKCT